MLDARRLLIRRPDKKLSARARLHIASCLIRLKSLWPRAGYGFGKQQPQLLSRPSEPAHDSSGGASQYRSNLLIAESFHIAKQYNFAVQLREAFNSGADLLALYLLDIRCVRVLTDTVQPVRAIFRIGVKLYKARATARVAKLVEPYISHYGKHPALKIAIGDQLAERSDGAQIGLLHKVFGLRLIANERHRKSVERVYVLEGRACEAVAGCTAFV